MNSGYTPEEPEDYYHYDPVYLETLSMDDLRYLADTLFIDCPMISKCDYIYTIASARVEAGGANRAHMIRDTEFMELCDWEDDQ